jgi:hypothetical protein
MTPFGPAMPMQMQMPCMSAHMVPQIPSAETLAAPTHAAHAAYGAPAQFSMEESNSTAKADPYEPCLLTCGGIPCSTALSEELPHPDDLPSASLLAKSAELSDVVAEQMDSCDRARLGVILRWLQAAALELAFSACGCRVVQKAFEVAGGDDRTALVDQLRGHVVKLVESPHGNHVLQKCIETLPNNSVQFVIDELGSGYRGGWATLARHRYGCRVEERLIEQFPEEMLGLLMTAVIADTHTLCYHPYGNYVLQHVLEYGSKEKRSQIISILIKEDIVSLAQHNIAGNVVEKALEHCGSEGQQTLANAILAVNGGLLAMGCSRYGSQVAKKLLEILSGALREEAVRQLQAGFGSLRSSKYGRAIAQRIGATANASRHQPFEV